MKTSYELRLEDQNFTQFIMRVTNQLSNQFLYRTYSYDSIKLARPSGEFDTKVKHIF